MKCNEISLILEDLIHNKSLLIDTGSFHYLESNDLAESYSIEEIERSVQKKSEVDGNIKKLSEKTDRNASELKKLEEFSYNNKEFKRIVDHELSLWRNKTFITNNLKCMVYLHIDQISKFDMVITERVKQLRDDNEKLSNLIKNERSRAKELDNILGLNSSYRRCDRPLMTLEQDKIMLSMVNKNKYMKITDLGCNVANKLIKDGWSKCSDIEFDFNYFIGSDYSSKLDKIWINVDNGIVDTSIAPFLPLILNSDRLNKKYSPQKIEEYISQITFPGAVDCLIDALNSRPVKTTLISRKVIDTKITKTYNEDEHDGTHGSYEIWDSDGYDVVEEEYKTDSFVAKGAMIALEIIAKNHPEYRDQIINAMANYKNNILPYPSKVETSREEFIGRQEYGRVTSRAYP